MPGVAIEEPEFALSVRMDGAVAVVAVEGTVDLYTARDLRTALNEAVSSSHGWVVLDLSDATFIDSTGIAALIGAHRRAERLGGLLVVVNEDREISRLLEVTGLDSLLSLAGDREAALEMVRSRRAAG